MAIRHSSSIKPHITGLPEDDLRRMRVEAHTKHWDKEFTFNPCRWDMFDTEEEDNHADDPCQCPPCTGSIAFTCCWNIEYWVNQYEKNWSF